MNETEIDIEVLEEVLRAIIQACDMGLDGDCDDKLDALDRIRRFAGTTLDEINDHASS